MHPLEERSPGFSGPRRLLQAGGSLAELSSRIRLPVLPRAVLIEAQRVPDSLSATEGLAKAAKDPTPKQRLIMRTTLGWTLAEQALAGELGYDAYLERQLDWESIDASPLEDALHEALPTLSMTPYELFTNYEEERPEVPAIELLAATFYRSIYSPRQLYERMAVFWTDHFNIDLFSDFANVLKPIDDRDVIRPHALGKFPDLLRASAHSPAMLIYLTNDSNVAGHPNENYARELMELHTLGADRGYTQEDVREMSRALTGWTVKGFEFGRRLGQFHFARDAHDDGVKTLLGNVLPAGRGIEDGEDALDILAEHPNTADFVARKLMRYLWGYEPAQNRVDRVAEVYLDTGGDIREMLRLILKPAWMRDATDKLKRPYHMVVSAIRALGADLEDPGFVFDWLYAAGHLPFTWPPPNGFPDTEGFWSSYVLPRWNFSAEMFDSALSLNAPALDPSNNRNLTRAKLRARLDRQLMGGRTSGATKTALAEYLRSVPFNSRSVAEAIGLMVALARLPILLIRHRRFRYVHKEEYGLSGVWSAFPPSFHEPLGLGGGRERGARLAAPRRHGGGRTRRARRARPDLPARRRRRAVPRAGLR